LGFSNLKFARFEVADANYTSVKKNRAEVN